MKKDGFFLSVLVILSAAGMNLAGAAAPQQEAGSLYGTISGVIEDRSGNTPLPWATVTLDNSGRGTLSNQDGEFTLSRIVRGEYTLIVVRIGYAQHKVEGIVVGANETVELPTIAM